MTELRHAVVMGGSMGGLLAARVLADHFEKVTLVERDVYPEAGGQRRGVPQGQHTHGLLASGRQVLERLFPGLTEALTGAGAVSGDILRDASWFQEGGCLAREASGLDGLMMSRPLLEGLVRQRLLALPNVTRRDGVTAQALLTNGTGQRVTGVYLRDERGSEDSLLADLVIDATGRGSRTPEWLREMGYAAPETDRVDVGVTYTTMCFERDPADLNGDLCAVIPPEPGGKRGGVMLAQEGQRWIVTLIRHFGAAAPADREGFRRFAAQLPAPFIHQAIRGKEPLGPAVTSRFPSSVRRRYERLSSFPEGYLVFGDAICSFNPIYGQGMSVAALQAMALGECLTQGADRSLARRFFRRAARVADTPWAIAAGNDLRMPEAAGERSLRQRFLNWYTEKFQQAAHQDAGLALAFHRVSNLLDSPASLLHPRLVKRVIGWHRDQRLSATALNLTPREAVS